MAIDDVVLIPVGVTPTGVGIALTGPRMTQLVPLCPGCEDRLLYQRQKGPNMSCRCAHDTPRKFPGIAQEEMSWAGPYTQCSEPLSEVNRWSTALWVERWTGLRGIEVELGK